MSRFQDNKFKEKKENPKDVANNSSHSRFNDSKANQFQQSTQISNQTKSKPKSKPKSKLSDNDIKALPPLEKSNTSSKLIFDNPKDIGQNKNKADLFKDNDLSKKPQRKLIFRAIEEKNSNGQSNIKFNLTENKRFKVKKEKRVRLNSSTTIIISDKDTEKLNQQLKRTKKQYKLVRKELKYEKANKEIVTSRLYNHDNSSKLQLALTPPSEPISRLNPGAKSQLAIKLYHKHNPKKEPYDIQQLRKYNLNFNQRSAKFVFNRANFKQTVTRENFLLYTARENFIQDTQIDKKLNFEEKKEKLKVEKKIVKKVTKVQKKQKIKEIRKARIRRFIKKGYATAFRKTLSMYDKDDKNNKTNEDYQSIKRGIRKVKRYATQIIKLISKLLAKLSLPIIGFIIIIVMVFGGVSMIVTTITGVISAVFGEMSQEYYESTDEDILETNDNFIELENDLMDIISNIPNNYPGYDRYDLSGINLNDITHDPYELTALLTALLGTYTPETAQVDIAMIFDLMFTLVYEEVHSTTPRPVVDEFGMPVLDVDGNPLTEDVPIVTLVVTLETKTIEEIAREILTDDEFERYEILVESQGHSPDLFSSSAETYSLSVMSVETNNNPSIVTSHHMITNPQFAKTVKFGEQFIGMKYVFGGSTPETGFDCSGFISYILNETGVASFSRTTAQGLYNMSTPIQNGQQQAGDLVFFQGTYNTTNTVTHVGYYVGNGMMLHCGNPIGYVDINSSAYAKSFYAFGRIE